MNGRNLLGPLFIGAILGMSQSTHSLGLDCSGHVDTWPKSTPEQIEARKAKAEARRRRRCEKRLRDRARSYAGKVF